MRSSPALGNAAEYEKAIKDNNRQFRLGWLGKGGRERGTRRRGGTLGVSGRIGTLYNYALAGPLTTGRALRRNLATGAATNQRTAPRDSPRRPQQEYLHRCGETTIATLVDIVGVEQLEGAMRRVVSPPPPPILSLFFFTLTK